MTKARILKRQALLLGLPIPIRDKLLKQALDCIEQSIACGQTNKKPKVLALGYLHF
jgi:hypothetical protein